MKRGASTASADGPTKKAKVRGSEAQGVGDDEMRRAFEKDAVDKVRTIPPLPYLEIWNLSVLPFFLLLVGIVWR